MSSRSSPRLSPRRSIGPAERSKIHGRRPRGSVKFIWAIAALALCASGLSAVISALPGGPVAPRDGSGLSSNACSVDLGDGDVDGFWATLNNASEGSTVDPNEPGIVDDVDVIRARVCNNATWLFFWGERAGTVPALPASVDFYLDTDGDGGEDFALMMDFTGFSARLWQNLSSVWTEIVPPPADRWDPSTNALSFEIGVEMGYLSLLPSASVRYYTTSEPDAVAGGGFYDRGPDAGWSGMYAVPEAGGVGLLAAAGVLALVPLVLIRRRGNRTDSI